MPDTELKPPVPAAAPAADSLLTIDQTNRAWRFVTIAGMFSLFYFTVEYLGAARIRYFTELGATAFDIGLIAAIYALAFGMQLVCGMLINRMARRKRIFIFVAALHRVLFMAVPLAAYLFEDGRARVWWIIGAMLIHDLIYQMAVPLFFSWMADLVPAGAINRYWGGRQRFITLATIIVNLILAFGFHAFERSGQVVPGFLLFSILAVACGLIDIALFAFVPEPPNMRAPSVSIRAALAQPLRDPNFRRFLTFMVYWFFITMLAAPFFALYMIKGLGMTVLTVQLVMVAEAVGGIASARLWGLICDNYGQENGIQLSLLFKTVIPLTLILAPIDLAIATPALILAFFLDGLMNAGFLIAWQGAMLKSSPRVNRPMYIAATNFLCQGLAGGLAPLLAGALIEPLGRLVHGQATGHIHWNGYLIIFAVSLVGRVAAWPIAWRMQKTAPVSFWTMVRHLRHTNPIRVTRALYRLHGSPAPAVRMAAATRLGRLHSPLAIRGLIDALRDPAHGVREAAADALGKIGMAEACEPLARALCDPASDIRPLAARALGRIGGTESLKTLLTAINTLDAEALENAIEALGRIGHDAAILPLICLFEEVENPVLRRRIAEALGRLTRNESSEEVLAALI